MTIDLAAQYLSIRDRIAEFARPLDADQLATVVPSCPDWTIQQLLAHVVSLPSAILAGNVPQGDQDAWIQGLVDERADATVEALLAEWGADDAGLAALIANAGLLLADLFVHESDLHGAIGSTGHRNAPELDAQLDAALRALAKELAETDLGPVAVEHDGVRWTSGDGEPGWTLRCDPWEAQRALSSRRTAEELVAIPAVGDAGAYIAIIDAHLPLPTSSLNES